VFGKIRVLENAITCGDSHQLLNNVADGIVDLIVCDGPYGVTQNLWDNISCIQDYNLELIKVFSRKLREGGALYLFGKQNCIDFIDYRPFLNLKTRIVWYQPSRLAQGRLSYTNNHDIICYFIKGKRPNSFNLDSIRVAQLVELEHRLRCERVPSVVNGQYGKTKFNDKGKNPGDVWGDIKQLTYNSKELVSRAALNTIQKPEKLMQRLILASSNPGDLVLDPFSGVGTCPVVCKRLGRRFIAFEGNANFVKKANERLSALESGQQSLDLVSGA
jgi:site-specific DNA-methyltransferase (adenine-specific)/adenine-specific DNA-methyltransferase